MAEPDRLLARIAGRFARVQTRRRARGFVFGLLAELPRTSCWSLAEYAADADPHGMQYFLSRARWATDGVRDDLRDYVTGRLADTDAVLVLDQTGDLKKARCTVGVQRQCTGTAGRIENAQVAVYLVYAGARGHAMIDRELYLPRCWTDDPDRCEQAGVPEGIEFAASNAPAGDAVFTADCLLAAAAPGEDHPPAPPRSGSGSRPRLPDPAMTIAVAERLSRAARTLNEDEPVDIAPFAGHPQTRLRRVAAICWASNPDRDPQARRPPAAQFSVIAPPPRDGGRSATRRTRSGPARP